jgi:SAM-dependent methyltransferase
MYEKSAKFYDAIYSFKNYEKEVDQLREVVDARIPQARTLLDVACGTGKHLDYFQSFFECEGLEYESEFVDIARGRLPGVAIHQGDFRDFGLGKRFDVVTCLFSAIGYAHTPEGLHSAVDRMAQHLSPDGALIIEPWFFPGQFLPGHVGMTISDSPVLKICRMNTGRIEGILTVMDMHHLVGTPDEVVHFVETHTLALFTREQYEEAFRAAGLNVEFIEPGLIGRGLFVGTRP